MSVVRSLAFVIVCSLAASAAPPEGPPSAVPLESVVADVLSRNAELRFYEAEIAAAKGEQRTARTWENPELSAGAGRKEVGIAGLSDEGTAWAVSLQQPFPWPGRTSLRRAIADRQIQLAELGLTRFKASLAARARLLGYTVFAAQEKASAAGEVAERFRTLRQVLVQRDPAGLTPQLEMRIIEATELTLQRRASEAGLAADAALLEMNQLRGEPFTTRLVLHPVALEFPTVPDDETLLSSAQANNFDLQIRRAELEQQGFRVQLARKEGRPSISVGPYYAEEKAGDREKQYGVGLSLALPLWDRNQGGVAAAEARRLQAETSLQVAQRDTDRRVLEAALAYRRKVAEMSRWRPGSIEEFRKAAELADRHYRLGAVPIATYVELQQQYLDAVEALLDTRREALEAGQELQLLTGIER